MEEDGRWHLTPRGFLVSNQIIGGMLDALAADKQRRADAAAPGRFPGEPGLNEKSRPLECSGGRFFLMAFRARMALTGQPLGRVEGPRLLRRVRGWACTTDTRPWI